MYSLGFSIQKMVGNEYSAEGYKPPKINVGTNMEKSEMLKCEYAVKKLPFVIRYFPGQYKTQQMSDKAFLENCGTL